MSPRALVGMVVPSIRQGPRKRSLWGCGECESSGISRGWGHRCAVTVQRWALSDIRE